MVSYKYDEWGKLLNIDALNPYHPVAKYNPYIYKSYYYDYESKMYYLNSRYYHPFLRRFLTIDDIDFLDKEQLGNLNLYLYCRNNPILGWDPSGHFVISFALAVVITTVVSAGLGAGYGAISAISSGRDVGAGAVIGAISFGLMGFAACFGPVAGAIVGVVAGAGAELSNQLINNEEIDVSTIIFEGIQNGIINGISGGLGGILKVDMKAVPLDGLMVTLMSMNVLDLWGVTNSVIFSHIKERMEDNSIPCYY